MNFITVIVGIAALIILRLVLGQIPPLPDNVMSSLTWAIHIGRGLEIHGLLAYIFSRLEWGFAIVVVFLVLKAVKWLWVRFGSGMTAE